MSIILQLNKIVYSLMVAIFVVTMFGFLAASSPALATTASSTNIKTTNYGLDTVAKKSGLVSSSAIDDTDAFIGNLIRILLGFVGTVFLLLVIYAGITWMTAAGNEDRIAKAKKILVSAAIGLALTVLSYAIASFIASAIINSSSDTNNTTTGTCEIEYIDSSKTCFNSEESWCNDQTNRLDVTSVTFTPNVSCN